MREVVRALATMVLADSRSAEAAVRWVAREGVWGPALGLAAAWRVVPQLRRQLAALPVELEAHTHRQLREACIVAAIQSTAVTHRASVVLERLRGAGVLAMAFKGVGLIANLYPGPGQRMVNDADLLVKRDDLERTWAVLGDLRFRPVVEEPLAYVRDLDDYRPFEGAFLGNQCLVFVDEDQVEIDLHWRLTVRPLAPMATESILRRAERVTLFGRQVLVAAPMDAITLTAHHAIRQNFAPASTVKDLADLRAWWSVQSVRWSPREVSEHAHQSGLGVPLQALWRILSTFDSAIPAQSGLDSRSSRLSRREDQDATLLADLFHVQLRQGEVNRDLLCLLSPVTIKRFLLKRYRAPALSVRPIGDLQADLGLNPPQPIRDRVTRLLRALVRLTPRALAGYRALLRAHLCQGRDSARDEAGRG